jgi:predicted dehydrogenase
MSKQFRIALLGAGRWGVNLLRNFLAHPQFQVAAIVDPNKAQLDAVADRFKLHPQVLLTQDWQDGLQVADLNAVVVATPAITHYTLILAALQKSYHVLAEKPLTLTVAESLELCRFAEQQRCQLVIDHTYLFHPVVSQGREILQQGRLGKLRYGYAARTHLGPVRQDVDALWDLAIHDICIFNSWLRQSPCQVAAKGTVWLQPSTFSGLEAGQDSVTSPTAGLADLVWVTLTYPDGFQALIHLCWANPDKQRRLCVVGDRATLIFDELQVAAPLVLQQGEFQRCDRKFMPVNQYRELIELPQAEPLKTVCDHFYECIEQNQPSTLSSGWLGAELVQILVALSQSLSQGGQPIALTDI